MVLPLECGGYSLTACFEYSAAMHRHGQGAVHETRLGIAAMHRSLERSKRRRTFGKGAATRA